MSTLVAILTGFLGMWLLMAALALLRLERLLRELRRQVEGPAVKRPSAAHSIRSSSEADR